MLKFNVNFEDFQTILISLVYNYRTDTLKLFYDLQDQLINQLESDELKILIKNMTKNTGEQNDIQ